MFLYVYYVYYYMFIIMCKFECFLILYIHLNVLLILYLFSTAELGDYSPDEHGHTYLAEMKVVPDLTDELEKKIIELHKLHK